MLGPAVFELSLLVDVLNIIVSFRYYMIHCVVGSHIRSPVSPGGSMSVAVGKFGLHYFFYGPQLAYGYATYLALRLLTTFVDMGIKESSSSLSLAGWFPPLEFKYFFSMIGMRLGIFLLER